MLTADVLERTYGARMEVLEHAGMPIVVDRYHATDNVVRLRKAGRLMDELLRPFEFEFFRNGLDRGHLRRRPVRPGRRLRRAARA